MQSNSKEMVKKEGRRAKEWREGGKVKVKNRKESEEK